MSKKSTIITAGAVTAAFAIGGGIWTSLLNTDTKEQEGNEIEHLTVEDLFNKLQDLQAKLNEKGVSIFNEEIEDKRTALNQLSSQVLDSDFNDKFQSLINDVNLLEEKINKYLQLLKDLEDAYNLGNSYNQKIKSEHPTISTKKLENSLENAINLTIDSLFEDILEAKNNIENAKNELEYQINEFDRINNLKRNEILELINQAQDKEQQLRDNNQKDFANELNELIDKLENLKNSENLDNNQLDELKKEVLDLIEKSKKQAKLFKEIKDKTEEIKSLANGINDKNQNKVFDKLNELIQKGENTKINDSVNNLTKTLEELNKELNKLNIREKTEAETLNKDLNDLFNKYKNDETISIPEKLKDFLDNNSKPENKENLSDLNNYNNEAKKMLSDLENAIKSSKGKKELSETKLENKINQLENLINSDKYKDSNFNNIKSNLENELSDSKVLLDMIKNSASDLSDDKKENLINEEVEKINELIKSSAVEKDAKETALNNLNSLNSEADQVIKDLKNNDFDSTELETANNNSLLAISNLDSNEIEERVKNLTTEISKAKEKIQNGKTEVQTQINEKIKEAKGLITDLYKESLSDQAKSLENSINNSINSNDSVTIPELNKELENLNKEISKAKSNLAEREKQKEAEINKLRSLEEELKTLTPNQDLMLDNITNLINSAINDSQKITNKNTLEEIKNAIKKIESKKDFINQEKQNKIQSLEKIDKTVQKAKQVLGKLKELGLNSSDLENALQKSTNNLGTKNSDAVNTLNEILENAIKSANKLISKQSDKALEDLNNKIVEANILANNLRDPELKNDLKKLQNAITNAEQNNNDLSKEQLKAKEIELQAAIDEAKRAKKINEEEKQNALTELEKAKEALDNQKIDDNNYKNVNNDINEALKKANIVNSTNTLKEIKDAIKNLEEAKEKAVNEKSAKEQEINTLNAKIEQARTISEKLKNNGLSSSTIENVINDTQAEVPSRNSIEVRKLLENLNNSINEANNTLTAAKNEATENLNNLIEQAQSLTETMSESALASTKAKLENAIKSASPLDGDTVLKLKNKLSSLQAALDEAKETQYKNNLDKQKQAKDDELRELEKEILGLVPANVNNFDNIKKLANQAVDKSKKVTKDNSTLKVIENEIDSLKNTKEELIAEKLEKENNLSLLKTKHEEAKKVLEDLKSNGVDTTALQSSINLTNPNNNQLVTNKPAVDIKSLISNLENAINKAQNDIVTAKEVAKAALNKIIDKANALKDLMSDTDLSEEKSNLENAINNAQNNIDSLNVSQIKERQKTLEEALKNAQQKVDEYNKNKNKNSEIEKLRQLENDVKSIVNSSDQNLQNVKNMIHEAINGQNGSAKVTKSNSIEEITSAIQKLKTAQNSIQREKEAKINQIASLSAAEAEIEKILAKLNQNNQINSKNELKNKLNEIKNNLSNLSSEEIRQKINNLKTLAKDKANALNDLILKSKKALENEIAEAKKLMTALKDSALIDQKNKVQAAITKAQKDLKNNTVPSLQESLGNLVKVVQNAINKIADNDLKKQRTFEAIQDLKNKIQAINTNPRQNILSNIDPLKTEALKDVDSLTKTSDSKLLDDMLKKLQTAKSNIEKEISDKKLNLDKLSATQQKALDLITKLNNAKINSQPLENGITSSNNNLDSSTAGEIEQANQTLEALIKKMDSELSEKSNKEKEEKLNELEALKKAVKNIVSTQEKGFDNVQSLINEAIRKAEALGTETLSNINDAIKILKDDKVIIENQKTEKTKALTSFNYLKNTANRVKNQLSKLGILNTEIDNVLNTAGTDEQISISTPESFVGSNGINTKLENAIKNTLIQMVKAVRNDNNKAVDLFYYDQANEPFSINGIRIEPKDFLSKKVSYNKKAVQSIYENFKSSVNTDNKAYSDEKISFENIGNLELFLNNLLATRNLAITAALGAAKDWDYLGSYKRFAKMESLRYLPFRILLKTPEYWNMVTPYENGTIKRDGFRWQQSNANSYTAYYTQPKSENQIKNNILDASQLFFKWMQPISKNMEEIDKYVFFETYPLTDITSLADENGFLTKLINVNKHFIDVEAKIKSASSSGSDWTNVFRRLTNTEMTAIFYVFYSAVAGVLDTDWGKNELRNKQNSFSTIGLSANELYKKAGERAKSENIPYILNTVGQFWSWRYEDYDTFISATNKFKEWLITDKFLDKFFDIIKELDKNTEISTMQQFKELFTYPTEVIIPQQLRTARTRSAK
ncbi:hypothetical protein [Mycoplasma buteonis]|uniref:hypothetical protein n=1 Tax=Mycoplasma buteonis TaxID=171280 RepID=UPI0005654C29|nr:hypothetical protein [Mycoplasma buteonis]